MRVLFKVTANEETTFHTCPAENQEKLKSLFEEFGAKVEIHNYPVALEVLPEETQQEVRNTLKAFNDVTVTFKNGSFCVSAAISVTSHYAYDHMVCGRYLAEQVYTKEERRQNFLEEFGYIPFYLK